jgi:hypothetical protein
VVAAIYLQQFPAVLSRQDEVTVTSLHATGIMELCESVGCSSMQKNEIADRLAKSEAGFRGSDSVHATGASLVRELQKEISIFLQMPRLSVTRAGRLLN